MQSTQLDTVPKAQYDAVLSEVAQLRHQLEWFRRQLFGTKSEKRLVEQNSHQGILGQEFNGQGDNADDVNSNTPNKTTTVAGHERKNSVKPAPAGDESTPFFDESKVPVEVIELPSPEAAGLTAEQYEVIGQKVSHRLAQRPGSYVVLKYTRPIIKRLDTQAISCAKAPLSVLEGSRADVSFMAGMLIDKCTYHLPFYRQHQRLIGAGIKVSRAWLTQIAQSTIALLEPIYEAQLASIRMSRVKLVDETPIKAGLARPGKMKTGQMWPIMGEQDEICFAFYPGRGGQYLDMALGDKPPDKAVLQTDGYAVYANYAARLGLTHAQCWAHTRREFIKAQSIEPERAEKALEMIGALYTVERTITEQNLQGDQKRALRQAQAKPIAEQLFAWINKQFDKQGFLPSSPFTKAMAYARERKEGLMVYLDDPDVAIDTNAIERALRVIPMGRKNWMFCWTELGAHQIGVMQSLLVTCKLHDIDPYSYLVDVLQRISEHPNSKIEELTPRRWKELFASNPLRSALHQTVAVGNNAAQ